MNKKTKQTLVAGLAATLGAGMIAPAVQAAPADANALYKTAFDAVVAAQSAGTQETINVARKAITSLQGTSAAFAVGEFSKQVDAVQQKLFERFMGILFDKNQKPVDSITQAQINEAKELVIAFDTYEGNKPYTASWSSAVDKYQQANIDAAKKAVEAAQKSGKKADIEAAQKLVDELVKVTNNDTVKKYAQELKAIVDKLAAELKIESVEATNLKEIVVTFNKEVDKVTAEDIANYKLTSDKNKDKASLKDATANLKEDGRTVVITLKTKASQQEGVKLTTTGVRDKDGKAIAKTESSFIFFDNQAPELEEVKVVGPKTVELNFNEPLLKAPIIKLDNGQVSATVKHEPGSRKVTVNFGRDLEEKEYTLSAEGGSDYANYKVVKVEKKFDYKKNTEALTGEIIKANQTEVVVKFNKPVKIQSSKKVSVYHSYNNSNKYKASSIKAVDSSDGFFDTVVSGEDYSDTYKFTFTAPMSDKTDYKVFINTEKNAFEDRWGNDVDSMELTTAVDVDVNGPEIMEVKATDSKITIKFNEKVNVKDAKDPENYVFKTSSGRVLDNKDYSFLNKDGQIKNDIITLGTDGRTVTLPVSFKNGSFKVEVSGIKDISYNENKMTTQEVDFEVGDETAPKLSQVTYNQDTKNPKLRVTFSERMDITGLDDLDNYQLRDLGNLDADGLGKIIDFHDDAEATVVDDHTVEIDLVEVSSKFTSAFTANKLQLEVSNAFKDLAGNKMENVYNAKKVEEDTISIARPELTARDTIKIEIDRELSGSLKASDFTIVGYDSKVTSASYENGSGKSTITLELEKKLATDAAPVVKIAKDAITDKFGNEYPAFTTQAALDKVKAEFVTTKIDGEDVADIRMTNNGVILRFSEPINKATVSNTTFEVYGVKITSLEWNTEAGNPAGTTVILKTTDKLSKGLSVTQENPIWDMAGNVTTDLKGKIISTASIDSILDGATVTELLELGITDANSNNIDAINVVLASKVPADKDNTTKVQAIVDGVNKGVADINAAPANATEDMYKAAGINVKGTLAKVNAAVKGARDIKGADLTAKEIQNAANGLSQNAPRVFVRQGNAAGEIRLLEATSAMEYSKDGAAYIACTPDIDISAKIGDKIEVRYAATGTQEASEAQVIVVKAEDIKPAVVVINAQFDLVTKKLTSVTEIHEYSLDGGKTWSDAKLGAFTAEEMGKINTTNGIMVRVKEANKLPASVAETIIITKANTPVAGDVTFAQGTTQGTISVTVASGSEYRVLGVDNQEKQTWTDGGAAADILVEEGYKIEVRVKVVGTTMASDAYEYIVKASDIKA